MRAWALLLSAAAVATTISVQPSAAQQPAESLYDSSVELTNASAEAVVLSVQPTGRSPRSERIEAGAKVWISCGGCIASGFDVMMGEIGKETHYFLPTGYRFTIKWNKRKEALDLFVVPWE